LLLNSKNQISALQQQLNSYMAAISKGELQLGANNGLSYNLEPLLSVHLHSALAGGLEPNGNMETISILSVIGLIILVIACINYVNITVVQATNKSTEIGVRKVLGASKTQIFGQIISSSVLITFISSIFGSLIAIVFLPSFNELTSRNLSALAMINPVYIFGIIIIGIIIAFLSGAYPAYFISNVKLASVLKSGFRLTNSGSPFRKALIIVQFTVSVALIIATIVIFQQLNFMQDKKLGYNRENLIEIPVNDISNKVYRQLKTQFATLPGVISVTGAYASPVAVKWADGIQKEKTSGNPEIIMKAMPCDTGFLKTMDIKMIIGNDFNAGDFNLLDTLGGRKNFRQSFILNESAVKALGWNNETALGKTLYRNGTEYGMVKGVVHDFHFATLHDKIGPLIMILDTAYLSNIYLKLAGSDSKRLIGLLISTWAKNVSNTPFEYHFLDEQYNNLYKGEEKTAKTFSIFSILAIVLACMGVFALAAFDAVQRAKEIGIRKVLGATITNITLLLANGFIKLVFIAILIATPLTYYLVNNWLQGYAYRIVISIWVFILAGALVIVIAFITTSFLTIKAAIANPVKSLRSE
jgi:putative ABC transport system permease protein